MTALLETTQQAATIDDLRELLHDGAPDEVRRARLDGLTRRFPESMNKSRHAARDVLHRVSAFLHADEPLDEWDRQRIAHLFPMELRTVDLPDKTLKPGEVWDLGTSTSPVVVNLGTLTMGAGSSIVIRNTALKFTVENLVRQDGAGGPVNYDLGLLGRQGAAGSLGQTGGDGGRGNEGKPGTCTSGGGIAGDDGGPGTAGSKGAQGGPGGRGQDGFEALSATIVITKSITASQFVILTQSGFGGSGGTGGPGGAGGPGGRGGTGATCGCEHTNGGSGAEGGSGGDGGVGGDGGDGSPGMDIYVTVPAGTEKLIVANRQDAQPGEGGPGGPGGSGGAGGSGGGGGGASGCPQGYRGGSGGTGAAGNPGNKGNRGKNSGAAGQIYVNGSAK